MKPLVSMPEVTEEQLKAIKEESSFRATVLERLDNLFSKIAEILTKVDDLNNRKADKALVTSFETIQSKLKTDLDDLKIKHEEFKDIYELDKGKFKIVLKIVVYLWGGAGVLWPIVLLYAAKYWV